MKYSSTSGFKLLAFLFALAAMVPTSGCGPTNGLLLLTGEFLYVSNSQDAVVSEFSIDTATGLLSFAAQFVAEPGAETRGLAIHPSNEFIYDAASFPGNVDLLPAEGRRAAALQQRSQGWPLPWGNYKLRLGHLLLWRSQASETSEVTVTPVRRFCMTTLAHPTFSRCPWVRDQESSSSDSSGYSDCCTIRDR